MKIVNVPYRILTQEDVLVYSGEYRVVDLSLAEYTDLYNYITSSTLITAEYVGTDSYNHIFNLLGYASGELIKPENANPTSLAEEMVENWFPMYKDNGLYNALSDYWTVDGNYYYSTPAMKLSVGGSELSIEFSRIKADVAVSGAHTFTAAVEGNKYEDSPFPMLCYPYKTGDETRWRSSVDQCLLVRVSDGDTILNVSVFRSYGQSGTLAALKYTGQLSLTYYNITEVGSRRDIQKYIPMVLGTVIDPDDPFGPGGTSEPGGGGGTFDDDSDEIPDSSLPTLSAANTGFTRIYNPTLSQVQAMANYLWTDDSVIETIWNHIKQFLEDPMDAFIAFNLVPCVVPNGGTSNFKVMYIDTGVSMTTAANQFVDVDCGTVQLDRYYGSALDYTPYTRVGCFLPYIGTVELDTDEVMGATLQVKYRIDIVSGACVAKIFVDGTCLYQYSGHCAINIPFTSADFSNYVNAIIQVAKAGLIAASGVPIAAAGAGEAAEQLTGRTVTTTKTTRRNPATGRQIVTGTETTERDIYSTEASFKGLSPSNLANTVGAVMGSKPMIEHSGGFNGNSGYLGIRRPFLIIKRPRMCNPSGYGALNGYPCMIKETLGNLSGYTQVQQVQLTGLSATNPEQAEILQLLKQGVIL